MLINGYITASAGGAAGAVPLFWWQGWSRHWYLTSVFDLVRFECPERGTFLVVRRESDMDRTPLMVGTANNVGEDLYSEHGDALMRAIKAGANEVHVHLAAENTYQREAAVADIARGWGMTNAYTRGYEFA